MCCLYSHKAAYFMLISMLPKEIPVCCREEIFLLKDLGLFCDLHLQMLREKG